MVTGAAGFIGSHLCERLLSEGNEVVGVDNFFTGDKRFVEHLAHNPLFRLVRHDITFPYFEEVDRIYNLACPSAPMYYMSDPVTTLKTSLLGAVNMLELARRTGARIVQASSGKVYGRVRMTPIPEQFAGCVDPVGEHSAYEEGKRAAETLFRAYRNQYGVDARIARLFHVYGPRMALDSSGAVSGFIRSALRGENITIRSNGTQTRAFLYVDDAVDGLVRLMEAEGDIPGPVNIGGADPVRIDALAEDIVHLIGGPSKIVVLNLHGDTSQNATPDIGYARRTLGWEPKVPIGEGLTLTVRYFQEKLRNENRTYPMLSWIEMM